MTSRPAPQREERITPSYSAPAFLTPDGRTDLDPESLRNAQQPLKDRYRSQPQEALVTLRADGVLGEGVTCSVQTGRALVAAGLHPASGGDGMPACSGDMLLQALVACAGVTLKSVATSMEIAIARGRIHAEGDLDFRGTMAVSKEAPVGFAAIRLTFDVESNAPQERLNRLVELTQRYCVVYQTLVNPPPVEVGLVTTPSDN
jgi:uncharacterized OsmC-like protein